MSKRIPVMVHMTPDLCELVDEHRITLSRSAMAELLIVEALVARAHHGLGRLPDTNRPPTRATRSTAADPQDSESDPVPMPELIQ